MQTHPGVADHSQVPLNAPKVRHINFSSQDRVQMPTWCDLFEIYGKRITVGRSVLHGPHQRKMQQ